MTLSWEAAETIIFQENLFAICFFFDSSDGGLFPVFRNQTTLSFSKKIHPLFLFSHKRNCKHLDFKKKERKEKKLGKQKKKSKSLGCVSLMCSDSISFKKTQC